MNQLKHRFFFCVRFLSLVIILTNGLSAHATPNKASDVSAHAHAKQNYYAVKPGQSLQDVVAEMAKAGVVRTPKEQAQLTSALLKANPRAFIAGNPNRLRKDAILILPPGFARPQAVMSAAPAPAPAPVSASASAAQPTLPKSEEPAEADTQAQAEEQAAPSVASSAVEQQILTTPASTPVVATSPVVSASSTPAKVTSVFSNWQPQFTSIPKALMFVIAAIGSVLLVLILSLLGHRRAQKRMNEQRTHSVAPALTNATKPTQEPSEINEMMVQVASWAKQHAPVLPQPVPSSPVEQASAEVPPLPDTLLAEEAQPELNGVQQPQTGATLSTELPEEVDLSEPTVPAAPTTAEALASAFMLEGANEAELKKLEKANEAINLGDMEGARALISEVTELVETRLVSEQSKQTSIEPTAGGIEEISAEQKEEQQSTAPSASEAESLPAIDLPSETAESPSATYSEKMVAIERNKLALVGEYLNKLGDIEGARLLAQEVAASADPNLRARAEQILASLPAS